METKKKYKYEVLIKYSDGEIKSIKFQYLYMTARFLDLSLNQIRERLSWDASGLTKNVWHKSKNSINYKVKKIKDETSM